MSKNLLSIFLFICLFFSGTLFSFHSNSKTLSKNLVPNTVEEVSSSKQFYNALNEKELSFDAFEYAFQGYQLLINQNKLINKDILTIVDFSYPSNKERLFIIDIRNKKLISKSLVAHGRNTGQLKASKFSNIPQSYQSSLGFYLTAETYIGKHGYSLRLDGLEKNINDNARERAIVIHGADYVSNSFIAKHGRLGRSHGCPALPQESSEEIINTIKNKSCLFIYYPSEDYLSKTTFNF